MSTDINFTLIPIMIAGNSEFSHSRCQCHENELLAKSQHALSGYDMELVCQEYWVRECVELAILSSECSCNYDISVECF